MQVNKFEKNISFRSGLTTDIINKAKHINVQDIQNEMSILFINADFKQNTSIAMANKLCYRIFYDIAKSFNQFYSFPPCIKTYNCNEIIDKTSAQNFCIPDTKSVLINDYPYPGRSVFFLDSVSLESINLLKDKQYKEKLISSSHFLAPFIHEWVHSVQLDYIYSKFGYGGDCDYLGSIYKKSFSCPSGYDIVNEYSVKTLSKDENEIVFDVLGEYATKPKNQYFEVFAETVTKLICESLSKECKLIDNPLSILKKTPKAFQIIFRKITNFM